MTPLHRKRLRLILQKAIIPLLVIATSAYILTSSYRYHEATLRRAMLDANGNYASGGQADPIVTSNSLSNASHPPSPASNPSAAPTQKITNSTSNPISPAKAKTVTTSKTSGATATKQGGSAGSAPSKPFQSKIVLVHDGSQIIGTVQAAGSAIQATGVPFARVIQYGSIPTTTWSGHTIKGPHQSVLTLDGISSPNDLLVLPLRSGVLFATVAPTSLQPDGLVSRAKGNSYLFYSPYPAAHAIVPLVEHAEVLGTLPPTVALGANFPFKSTTLSARRILEGTTISQQSPVSGTTNNTSVQNTNQSATTANAANTTSATANSPQQATSTTNNAASGQNNSPSNVSGNNAINTPVSKQLAKNVDTFFAGLYQTNKGAIILLTQSAPDGSTTNVGYLWSEQSQSLTRMMSLPNSGDSSSWFAVSPNLVYFGTRVVNPNTPSAYTFHQFVYNIANRATFPLTVPTWIDSAGSFDDNLVFQYGHQTTSQEFIPGAALLKP